MSFPWYSCFKIYSLKEKQVHEKTLARGEIISEKNVKLIRNRKKYSRVSNMVTLFVVNGMSTTGFLKWSYVVNLIILKF